MDDKNPGELNDGTVLLLEERTFWLFGEKILLRKVPLILQGTLAQGKPSDMCTKKFCDLTKKDTNCPRKKAFGSLTKNYSTCHLR